MSLNELSKPVQTLRGASTASHGSGSPVTPAKPGKLLRLPFVEERTGLRKSTIYAGAKAKTFPAPVRLSARAVAWREEDIDRWISGRVTNGDQA